MALTAAKSDIDRRRMIVKAIALGLQYDALWGLRASVSWMSSVCVLNMRTVSITISVSSVIVLGLDRWLNVEYEVQETLKRCPVGVPPESVVDGR